MIPCLESRQVIVRRNLRGLWRLRLRFNSDYYLLTGRHEGRRLASLIDPEAVEDYDAFAGFIGNVYCPAVIVSHRNSEMIAEGLAEYFNK